MHSTTSHTGRVLVLQNRERQSGTVVLRETTQQTPVVYRKTGVMSIIRGQMRSTRIVQICVAVAIVLSVVIPVRASHTIETTASSVLNRLQNREQLDVSTPQVILSRNTHDMIPTRMINREEERITEIFDDCMTDSFFTRHQEVCMSNRMEVREVLFECAVNARFFRQHERFCERLHRMVVSEGSRCFSDESFRGVQVESCSHMGRLFEQIREICNNMLQNRMEVPSVCEDVRVGLVQLQQHQCSIPSQYTANQKTCHNLRYKMDDISKECQTSQRYYQQHQPICANHETFVKQQQQNCATDESQKTEHVQTCQNIHHMTKQQEERCNATTYTSPRTQTVCEDNKAYYVQIQQHRCAEDSMFFRENEQLCKRIMISSFSLVQRCDCPIFYQHHKQACDSVRFNLHRRQAMCSEKTQFLKNRDFCQTLRSLTRMMDRQCEEKSFLQMHRKTCGDNLHFLVQQTQQECNSTAFYQANRDVCRSTVRGYNQTLLGMCDRLEYYVKHSQACESQRLISEGQSQKCAEQQFYQEHEGVCQLRQQAVYVQQKQCQSQEYQTQHTQTCVDNQKYVTMTPQDRRGDTAETLEEVLRMLPIHRSRSEEPMFTPFCAMQKETSPYHGFCSEGFEPLTPTKRIEIMNDIQIEPISGSTDRFFPEDRNSFPTNLLFPEDRMSGNRLFPSRVYEDRLFPETRLIPEDRLIANRLLPTNRLFPEERMLPSRFFPSSRINRMIDEVSPITRDIIPSSQSILPLDVDRLERLEQLNGTLPRMQRLEDLTAPREVVLENIRDL